MPQVVSNTFALEVSDDTTVTVKTDLPAEALSRTPFFLVAHGANNDLDFPLLAYFARNLPERGTAAVVRFNFPYVERGVTSPDPRPVLEGTFERVYSHVAKNVAEPDAPIFVGGKSLGGRTAAELVSRRAEGDGLPATGLIVLGYPLHPMGREDHLRIEPLRHIDIPSLFFAGTRDPLCNPELLRPVLADLVFPGTLHVVKGGDHSLHLRRSSKRHPEDTYPALTDLIAAFINRTVSG